MPRPSRIFVRRDDPARSARWSTRASIASTLLIGCVMATGQAAEAGSSDESSVPPPLVLTGQTLVLDVGSESFPCGSGDNFDSLTAPGQASGPYPGTVSETASLRYSLEIVRGDSGRPTGRGALTSFSATFEIASPAGTVAGVKQWGPAVTNNSFLCYPPGYAFGSVAGIPYTAIITTPSGRYRDEGITTIDLSQTYGCPKFSECRTFGSLTETFISNLSEPLRIAPVNGEQCKRRGWQAFTQFRNQGQCVSSTRGGRI
jgi:hypothetical protein